MGEGVKLTNLDPQVGDTPAGADGAFNFICPRCRKGRVTVAVVLGSQRPGVHAHATTALPPAWDQMSVTPSIADEGLCTGTARGCSGWHGHIANGEVSNA
jgi:hypothetical protein